MRLWLFALPVLLVSCSASQLTIQERNGFSAISAAIAAFQSCDGIEGVSYVRRTNTVCIRESISPNTFQEFSNIWNSEPNIEHIVASGPGGQLTPALDIADLIRQRDISVVVGDICASSCSQFIFVAGARKYILQGGFVAFHGGPISSAIIDQMDIPQENKQFLKSENERFREFYREMNIDMKMLTEPPPEVQKEIDKGQLLMWTWDAGQLQSFGVQNVVAVAQ